MHLENELKQAKNLEALDISYNLPDVALMDMFTEIYKTVSLLFSKSVGFLL